MHIILTHEQADFDAVASQLGAFLLQEDTYAVLPKTLNRNVREFLHLYGSDLPFISSRELPKASITTVTLVDTQSLITIKGINKETQIFVIDHHGKKKGFLPDWEFNQVKSGACTTFFIEQLIEKNSYSLSIIEATLLLLGIYEDTGSLTYANTTARDASAVAYLLSHGASLKIASEFLNPQLSTGQQKLLEALIENSQTISIANQNIFVSSAEAPYLGDEVSSIAHKICDLIDPDALFIFVSIREGIRFVARSVSDQIDTSQIAKSYHGGGHKRASAALIKRNRKNPSQLKDIVHVFIDKLPEYVQPAVTVEQIMSKKPLTITPETTIDEALILMQHFGYEGYPVIRGKKIMGLLNRRAVDKAYAHNLNKTAASLMEAGDFHVYPDDSLVHLQQIMAKTGWGQIPVVDPISREIIGIATRTDLLTTLAGTQAGLTQKVNLAQEMEKKINPGQFSLLKLISITASEIHSPIYLVGGFVRDLILNSPSTDLDFVVEGNAIQLASLLADRYGGKVTSHKKFGTAKWWPLDNKSEMVLKEIPLSANQISDLPKAIDLISARTEFYEKPTALPTVKTGSIKLDLHRRDFTINTMAVRLDNGYFGDVCDHWGGLNDINQKKIRVLHSLSFVDDPTRILRAVRFEQRFGFDIEMRTLELIREAAPLLKEVSGDRIRHELNQILVEDKSIAMLSRINELGLFVHIHPAISWNKFTQRGIKKLLTKNPTEEWVKYLDLDMHNLLIQGAYAILLMRMPLSDLQKVINRLRFKNNLQKKLIAANLIWHNKSLFSSLTPGKLCQTLEKYPALAIYCNWITEENKDLQRKFEQFVYHWRLIYPKTTGEDLKQYGIPPGPIYHRILQKLRTAWINNEISSKGQEKKLLNEILSKPF